VVSTVFPMSESDMLACIWEMALSSALDTASIIGLYVLVPISMVVAVSAI